MQHAHTSSHAMQGGAHALAAVSQACEARMMDAPQHSIASRSAVSSAVRAQRHCVPAVSSTVSWHSHTQPCNRQQARRERVRIEEASKQASNRQATNACAKHCAEPGTTDGAPTHSHQ
jgi:hypothetical protein